MAPKHSHGVFVSCDGCHSTVRGVWHRDIDIEDDCDLCNTCFLGEGRRGRDGERGTEGEKEGGTEGGREGLVPASVRECGNSFRRKW